MNLSRVIALAASAAGLGTAAWLANRRSEQTAAETTNAVVTGGSFQTRLTGYWPSAATTAAEKKMEGGLYDRRKKQLHTLEQHQSDPVAHPYVSVSGDDAIFPYGQRLTIDAWPEATFRVVDTGSHFRGARKVYRILGREPLDVCVESPKTKVSPMATATIVKGDHLDKASKVVDASRFKGQDVAIGSGFDLLGAEAA